MRKVIATICLMVLVLGCNEEVKLSFEQTIVETDKQAKISIDIPIAVGTKSVTERINKTITDYVANINIMDTDSIVNTSLDDAVQKFNNDFIAFENEFPEEARPWEFFVDGEIGYQTPEIISISINSYVDTGGAHGNSIIRFFNFDPQTGKTLSKADIIDNIESFSDVVEQYFEKKTANKSESAKKLEVDMQDFFFGEDFQLPESIGFNDEGVIILYNTYEIAAYAHGITEFVIPFSEVGDYLSFE